MKIECAIDTGDKSVECKVDGKKVDNFGYLSVYGDKSAYGFMLSMASVEELEDGTKTTHWSSMANEIEDFLRTRGMSDKDMPMKEEDKKGMKKKMKKKMKDEHKEDMDDKDDMNGKKK